MQRTVLRPSRLLWLVLGLAALGYAALCAWIYVSQRSLIYHPRPAIDLVGGVPFEVRSGDVSLRGWALNPGQGRGLLYFGGNAEQVERRADLRAAVPGYTLYLLPYRGYGGNSGAPTEATLLADALAAFDAVAARHDRVSVIGTSLGSGVAVHVASLRPVERLALVMPYDSIEAVASHHYPWLPMAWLLEDKYDSLRRAADVRAEVLVLVAEHDQIIPRASTDRLLSGFTRPPQVQVIADTDHNTLSAHSQFHPALADFFAGPSNATER